MAETRFADRSPPDSLISARSKLPIQAVLGGEVDPATGCTGNRALDSRSIT